MSNNIVLSKINSPNWFVGPLRKFCVSDFRQKQEYHM